MTANDFVDLLDSSGLFLVQLLFIATIVLTAAGLATWFAHRASAAVRHRMWSLSVLALLGLPVISWWLPSVGLRWGNGQDAPRVTVPFGREEVGGSPHVGGLHAEENGGPIAQFAATIPNRDDAPHDPSEDAGLSARVDNIPASVVAPAPGPTPLKIGVEPAAAAPEVVAVLSSPRFEVGKWTIALRFIAAMWAVGVVACTVLLLRAEYRIRRIVGSGRPLAETADSNSHFRRLAHQLGATGKIPLISSGRTAVPFTAGWLRPVVVVPCEFDGWSDARRNVALAHELAHVGRRDVFWQFAARLACCLYWVHPLVWVAAWRMRVEREYASDDAVLSVGEDACDYASHLVDIAAALAGRRHGARSLVAMAGRSHVEDRVRAILDAARPRAPVGRRTRILLTGCVLLLAAGAGMLRPVDAERSVDGIAELKGAAPPNSPVHLEVAQAPADLPPRRLGTITGRVLDRAGGKGVPGVRVGIAVDRPYGKHVAVTDADGEYRFEDVPANRYYIDPNLTPGEWSLGTAVRVVWNDARAPDIVLRSDQFIEGTVLDADTRQPASGVEVVFTSNDRQSGGVVTSDDRGRFRINVAPGEYQVGKAAGPPRYAPSDFLGRPLKEGESVSVSVAAGVPAGVIFHVKRIPTFRGRVLHADGTPAAGVQVRTSLYWDKLPERLRDQIKFTRVGDVEVMRGGARIIVGSSIMEGGGNKRRSVTNEEGWFEESLGMNRPGVSVLREDMVTDIETIIAFNDDLSLVGAAVDGSFEVTLRPPGSVRFRITDHLGTAVEPGRITLTSRLGEYQLLDHKSLELKTEGDGWLRCDFLVPGFDYFLRVDGSQHEEQFTIAAGETRNLGELTLTKLPRPREEILADLASPDYRVWNPAVWELRRAGPGAEFAIPVLLDLAKNGANTTIQREMFEALGDIGPAAGSVIPEMIALVETWEWVPCDTFAKIGDARAMPLLKKALSTRGQTDYVAKAIAKFPADVALPVLMAALEDPDISDYDIYQALREMGPHASAAVPYLLRELGRQDSRRSSLISLLGVIRDPRALPDLERIALDPATDDEDFRAAAQAIDAIREAQAAVVPAN